MDNENIGIKLADGSFYPIMSQNSPARKKLEVTTVRDNQTIMQINLYRSSTNSMSDAEYVDTLMIENLRPHKSGIPAIEFELSLDENNMLSAVLSDAETGEKSDISVSLVSLSKSDIFDIPDFNLISDKSTDEMPTFPDDVLSGLGDPSKITATSTTTATSTSTLKRTTTTQTKEPVFSTAISDFDYLEDTPPKKKKNIPMTVCIICAILCLIAVGLIVYFSFLKKSKAAAIVEPAPVVQQAPVKPVEPVAEPEKPAEAEKAKENEIVVVATPVVVPEVPKPKDVEKPVKRYKIIWGDTLWDIADAYYKNPWLYKKIAQANGIKNPDYIISGTWIVIPNK